MENKKPSSFKFSVEEDERPDSLFQAKRENVWRENRRVESLSRRITLASVFILCMVGILCALAYFELEKRFANIHTSGSTEVHAIYQALDKKFSAMEDSFAKRVDSLEQSLAKLEKSVGGVAENLKKTEKTIENLRAAKADKKELSGMVAQMDKPLGPVRDELKNVRAEVQSLKEKLTELGTLSESVRTAEEKFTQMHTDMSDQLSAKIDQETLDSILKQQQQNYREELDLIIENLDRKEGKLNSLSEQMKKLERAAKKSGRTSRKSRKTMPSPKPANEKQPSVKHPIDEIKPAPGTFIEQDLQ